VCSGEQHAAIAGMIDRCDRPLQHPVPPASDDVAELAGDVQMASPVTLVAAQHRMTPSAEDFDDTLPAGSERVACINRGRRRGVTTDPVVVAVEYLQKRTFRRERAEMLASLVCPSDPGVDRKVARPRRPRIKAKTETLEHQRAIEKRFRTIGFERECAICRGKRIRQKNRYVITDGRFVIRRGEIAPHRRLICGGGFLEHCDRIARITDEKLDQTLSLPLDIGRIAAC
jgi:hypothetical protein